MAQPHERRTVAQGVRATGGVWERRSSTMKTQDVKKFNVHFSHAKNLEYGSERLLFLAENFDPSRVAQRSDHKNYTPRTITVEASDESEAVKKACKLCDSAGHITVSNKVGKGAAL
jgi:hypothetical protein